MKILLVSLILTVSISVCGQSFEVGYDHTALRVSDTDKSAEFYMKVFNLKEIETPASGSTLRWFSLGGDDQLHLIKGETKDIRLNKGVHIAFNIREYDNFLEHLKSQNIDFSGWDGEPQKPNLRGDGVRQVYIQDPDGYWIEVNDASY